MIQEHGQVIAVVGTDIWVQTIQQSACQSCSARHGCGQKALAGATSGRANQVLVANTLGAGVGDTVTLEMDESMLLRASVLVYGLPLLFTVSAAVVAQLIISASDGAAITGAGLGMAAGFWCSRWIQKRHGHQFQPRLAEVEDCYLNPTVF